MVVLHSDKGLQTKNNHFISLQMLSSVPFLSHLQLMCETNMLLTVKYRDYPRLTSRELNDPNLKKNGLNLYHSFLAIPSPLLIARGTREVNVEG